MNPFSSNVVCRSNRASRRLRVGPRPLVAVGLILTLAAQRASAQGCPPELSGDGVVDQTDLAVLIGQWGTCPPLSCAGDLNRDGVVNAQDIAELLTAWGPCDGALRWTADDDATSLFFSAPTALASLADGAIATLYAAGPAGPGSNPPRIIARRNGAQWSVLGPASSVDVRAFAALDGGSGPEVYAGGRDSRAWVGLWNGDEWTNIAAQLDGGRVNALATFDEGAGPRLIAAGWLAGSGSAMRGVARWDGDAWSPLGAGLNGTGNALAVYDDGSGPALYVGGSFSLAGGLLTPGLARWDGASWSSVGGGLSGSVSALAIFDDGSGPALYVGGAFPSAGGPSAHNIARWDGERWTTLGAGMRAPYPESPHVWRLAVFDDCSGRALYATGGFTRAGSTDVNGFARWNGQTWAAVPWEVQGPAHLTVHNDGSGDALYVGHYNTHVGRIARWARPTTCRGN